MLPLTAFGKNDIRGIYSEDITEEIFYYTGKGFIKYIAEKSNTTDFSKIWVTVCMDARTHSPKLSDALIKGVISTGANVVDLGLAPTPIGYYSEVVGVPQEITNHNKIMGALIITASHNPSQYNGLKMTFENQSLNEEQIKEVKTIVEQEYNSKKQTTRSGQLKKYDLIPDYIEEMVGEFSNIPRMINDNIKIVVDSGNATGGIVAPQLYRQLGCKVIELYSTPDGRFPNHHPNPSDPKNIKDLQEKVLEEKADIGIAFDGDSDRIGIVDSFGNHITGDKLLLIYAIDVIEQYKKKGLSPFVVSEVKCSQVLFDTINKLGGQAVMCKTGHGYIKSKMKETGAILAGEMSGHTFFKDRYYGFDDAVYAGCRIIEIIAKQKMANPDFKINDMLKPFDEVYSSPELRLPCPNELKKTVLKSFEEYVDTNRAIFGDPIKDIITLDGMRIVFDGGFALIRQSNTEPVFTCRFEAKTELSSNVYKDVMVNKINEFIEANEGVKTN